MALVDFDVYVVTIDQGQSHNQNDIQFHHFQKNTNHSFSNIRPTDHHEGPVQYSMDSSSYIVSKYIKSRFI